MDYSKDYYLNLSLGDFLGKVLPDSAKKNIEAGALTEEFNSCAKKVEAMDGSEFNHHFIFFSDKVFFFNPTTDFYYKFVGLERRIQEFCDKYDSFEKSADGEVIADEQVMKVKNFPSDVKSLVVAKNDSL
jgi:hypothetical protein